MQKELGLVKKACKVDTTMDKLKDRRCKWCGIVYSYTESWYVMCHIKVCRKLVDTGEPSCAIENTCDEASPSPQPDMSFEEVYKRFIESERMKDQMIHSVESAFTCTECGKKFLRAATLKKHRQTHSPEYPFECCKCGKRFRESDSLEIHKTRHTRQKKLECSECGKKFTSQTPLKRHLLAHCGIKPFKCNGCGKKFISKNSLNLHQQSHLESLFKCSMCEKWFNQRCLLTRHQRDHSRENP